MKLRIERKYVGMGALAAIAVAGLITGVKFYPEVRRYLRMKRM
jgi:hypothetical protein